MEVKNRVLEFIRYKQIPVKQFEAKSKLSNGYISSMRKGFGTGKLENVLNAFPDLNRDWLLHGEGNMLKSRLKHNEIGINNDISSLKELMTPIVSLIEKKDEQITDVIGIIKTKDEQINIKDGQITDVIEIIKSKDEQINRLLDFIENRNGEDSGTKFVHRKVC